VGQAYRPPVMGVPETGSPAATAGLALGDRIQAIDGQPIERWDEIETALRNSAGQPLRVTVLREGRVQEIAAEPRLTRAGTSSEKRSRSGTGAPPPDLDPHRASPSGAGGAAGRNPDRR